MIIVIPALNQHELTKDCVSHFQENEFEKNSYVIIDNGSTPPQYLKNVKILRNEKNVGLTHSLNQAFEAFCDRTDFIFYTHNDLIMHERNWDLKLKELIAKMENPGVIGFFGAKGIGSGGIYVSPYHISQMVRTQCVASMPRMEGHGNRQVQGEFEKVAVLDGMSLICSTKMLKMTHGFDEINYPIHHQYDNDICLQSIDNGFNNYVVPMDCQHLGGRTDVGEDWATPFGKTKQQVHEEAHPPFYEKWRPNKHRICLPYHV